jgi:septum formation protein
VTESASGPPRDLVIENARRKALEAAERCGAGRLVLGVDTAVVLGERAFGKPRDEREARAFLVGLSGRTHEVWSGIALVESPAKPGSAPGRADVAAAVTEVRFRSLAAAELDWYVGSEEWRGRAGGYAIQERGAALVEGIVGDYWNVVGLPVAELVRLRPGLIGR